MKKFGKVYIVGAGPGDPGLITLQAKQLLEEAEVVVYDYLVNAILLNYCSNSCNKIYVGKKAGEHTFSQDQINEILYFQANNGKNVVRLKGGDPFVFGRGGEEAQYLAQRNIQFEVVPGITSGIAAPAYAGIPVTHRDLTSTVTFITGHEAEGKQDLEINWQALASLKGTLVFYMGVRNLSLICTQLIDNGLKGETPVAIIRYGTYSSQQTITGTLTTIPEIAAKSGIKPPALIVVGEVVSLHDTLNWFSEKPLFGKRILVTRSRTQASTLVSKLSQKGAEVVEFPTIEILPADDYSVLHEAIKTIKQYQWIIFTSTNGVNYFFKHLKEAGLDSRILAHCKIASIGSETTNLLLHQGICPDLVPEEFTSESLVDTFQYKNFELKGVSILIPTSNISRSFIPDKLKKMGANPVVIAVYKNQLPEYSVEYLNELFSKPFDCVTFTSTSTVRNFVSILRKQHKEQLLNTLKIASIGPVTSAEIAKWELNKHIEANVHTIDCLVEEIEKHFNPEK